MSFQICVISYLIVDVNSNHNDSCLRLTVLSASSVLTSCLGSAFFFLLFFWNFRGKQQKSISWVDKLQNKQLFWCLCFLKWKVTRRMIKHLMVTLTTDQLLTSLFRKGALKASNSEQHGQCGLLWWSAEPSLWQMCKNAPRKAFWSLNLHVWLAIGETCYLCNWSNPF